MSDRTDLASVLGRLEAERLHWVALEGDAGTGRAVQVRRPTEIFMATLQGKAGREIAAAYAGEVVAWRGFTLRDLGVDSDELLPYSPRAWALLWPDRLEWITTLADQIPTLFAQHLRRREDAEKN